MQRRALNPDEVQETGSVSVFKLTVLGQLSDDSQDEGEAYSISFTQVRTLPLIVIKGMHGLRAP